MSDVCMLLNGVQDSPAAADRSLQGVVRLLRQSAAQHMPELLASIQQLLVLDQKHKAVAQYERFFARLLSLLPSKSDASALLHSMLTELVSHLDADSKHVRHHCTHMLVHVLGAAPAHTTIDDDLQQQLCSGLVQRLHDKQGVIRVAAAQALANLVENTQDDGIVEQIVAGMLEALAAEKLKAVRSSLVAHLPLTQEALLALVERLRDVEPQVRSAALQRLACLDAAAALSCAQRGQVVELALHDSDASVAEAAQQLLLRWLQQEAGGCPVKLLTMLDVCKLPDQGERMVRLLLSSGAIQVEQYMSTATKAHACPRQLPEGILMEGAAAFLWRCIGSWLSEEAVGKGRAAARGRGTVANINAATAADAHELLDELLPSSAEEALALVKVHAAAGAGGRYAATQLLQMAAKCMDWADAVNGPKALELARDLLLLDPRSEAAAAPAGVSWHQPLSGAGGDAAWEAAVVQLLQVASLNGRQFAEQALAAVQDMAAGWVLLVGEQRCCLGADPRCWRQLLQYMVLLGRKVPRGAASSLWQGPASEGVRAAGAAWQALLLGAAELEDTGIRCLAAESAVLFALPKPSSAFSTSAVQLLTRWVQQQEEPQVAAAAVKGLTDLCLCWGPGGMQAAAVAVHAEGSHSQLPATPIRTANSSSGASGEGAEGADAPGVAAGGVPQLLLVCMSSLLDEQAATMEREANPRSRKRPAADETAAPACLPAAQQQLFLAAVEAAAKLCLHHSLWLGQPQQALPSSTLRSLLSMLLLLTFHPATEPLSQLRACLSALWGAWPAAGAAHRVAIAAAGLPAAWQLLELPGRRQLAPTLLSFWQDLLLRAAEAAPDAGAISDALVVQQLLMDVQLKWESCLAVGQEVTRYKPYVVALLQVASSLPLQPTPSELAVLRCQVARLQGGITDKALLRELEGLAAVVHQQEAAAAEALTEEDLEELIARLEQTTLEQQQKQQGGGAAGPEGLHGRPSRGRGRATRGGRRGAAGGAGGRHREVSDGSGSEEDEEGTGPVVHRTAAAAGGAGDASAAAAGGRRQPSRAARGKGVDLAGLFRQEEKEGPLEVVQEQEQQQRRSSGRRSSTSSRGATGGGDKVGRTSRRSQARDAAAAGQGGAGGSPGDDTDSGEEEVDLLSDSANE